MVATIDTPQERDAQRSYWQEHSTEATVEAMMLDSQASVIDKQERPEVVDVLGPVHDKRVLELGAGIGRFTGELATTAKTVLAVDFMENLIEENKRTHGNLKNVSHRVADATELMLEHGSFDVVFSNWLLMYLNDAEVTALAENMLTWVCPGGIVFFRESCFRQSGDKKRKNNPTHYRNPREYFAIFDNAYQLLDNGQFAHFELVRCKCVDTYVRVKHNQNQICWKWRKVVSAERPERFRHFLDSSQYSNTSISRYERIFGPGFVSTGGISTTQEFVQMLSLQADERVLDVGCGIGGGDFYMARECDVFVHGLDLSVNMLLTAIERANTTLDSKVSFEIADCTTCTFPEASFDVVYSRDTLLHIQDKPALFKRFLSWLKPGGKLLISDYCKSDATPSAEFQTYIAQRGYDLHSVTAYGSMLKEAGFEDVVAEDRTWQFETCLRRELDEFSAHKNDFVRDFSEEDFNVITGGWNDKLLRVAAGEQKWGLFRARKPEQ